MSIAANTIQQNQQNYQLDDTQKIWLFGYGSLIYKVDFPYIEKRQASIKGWTRRFWQGSHDHRGTPESPGRVVTLIESPHEVCGGLAYLVEATVFHQLDIREQNGYLRFSTEMTFADSSVAQGLIYIATTENEAFLGEDSDLAIAQHIHKSHGPSGPNSEYLLCLAQSLREMSIDDEHVFALESALLKIEKGRA